MELAVTGIPSQDDFMYPGRLILNNKFKNIHNSANQKLIHLESMHSNHFYTEVESPSKTSLKVNLRA
jgi:hypothetical protein